VKLGLAEVDAKVADLDDESARMAGIILNELRGSPDVESLQRLAQDLASRAGLERMASLLPWTEDVVRRLAQVEAVEEADRNFTPASESYVGRVPLVTTLSEAGWDALESLMGAWDLRDVGEAVERAIMAAHAQLAKAEPKGGGRPRRKASTRSATGAS
jgi:hypothetical protein